VTRHISRVAGEPTTSDTGVPTQKIARKKKNWIRDEHTMVSFEMTQYRRFPDSVGESWSEGIVVFRGSYLVES